MDKRTPLSFSAAVLATLIAGIPARGAENRTSQAGDQTAEHQARKKSGAEPAAPRPVAADPYRCQPSQDISCTVVRETAQGTLIVTMRRTKPAARPPAWTVISGAPPIPGQHPGGTVYVVPNDAPDAHSTDHQASLSPKGAPILD